MLTIRSIFNSKNLKQKENILDLQRTNFSQHAFYSSQQRSSSSPGIRGGLVVCYSIQEGLPCGKPFFVQVGNVTLSTKRNNHGYRNYFKNCHAEKRSPARRQHGPDERIGHQVQHRQRSEERRVGKESKARW